MNWTDEQHAEMARRFESGGVLAVASYAVELKAECGGTMTAEDLADLERGAKLSAIDTSEAFDHIREQGATVATLQAKVERDKALLDAAISAREELKGEVTALRAEVERLKAEVNNKEVDRAFAVRSRERHIQRVRSAESRLAAIRAVLVRYDCEDAPDIAKTIEDVREALEGDAQQEAKDDGRAPRTRSHARLPDEMTRYPCFDTCTHDDAATPGHPEWVKERSDRLNEALFRSDDDPSASESDAYDRSAETMRAAVEQWARECFGDVPPTLKAVLDGVA